MNIDIQYIPTMDNIADIFTIALPIERFEMLRDLILTSKRDLELQVSRGVSDETCTDVIFLTTRFSLFVYYLFNTNFLQNLLISQCVIRK